MLLSNQPQKISTPFANTGSKNTIPVASIPTPSTAAAASFTDGFPPVNATNIVAGGIPPVIADMNGILNTITKLQQFQSAGGMYPYDATFSAAIGGYPQGAVVLAAGGVGSWQSMVDNNTNNPDAGGAGWLYFGNGLFFRGNGFGFNTGSLAVSQLGQWVELFPGATATLPDASLCPIGSTFTFRAPSGVNTIKGFGTQTITGTFDDVSNTLALSRGETVTVANFAGVGWYVTGNGFGSQNFKSGTAYQYLPGGFLMQWVTGVCDASGNMTVTNPQAFATGPLGGMANESSPSGWTSTSASIWGFDLTASTTTTSVARCRNVSGAAGPSISAGTSGRILVWGK